MPTRPLRGTAGHFGTRSTWCVATSFVTTACPAEVDILTSRIMEASRDENLVVLSGVPTVPQQSQRVLNRFLLRKLSEANVDDHSKIYVPVGGTGHSLGYNYTAISYRDGPS